jgi:hypothetical protein
LEKLAQHASIVLSTCVAAIVAGCGAAPDADAPQASGESDAIDSQARGSMARRALDPARAPDFRRPPGVPIEFVLTPSGYMHPSCVYYLAAGEIARDGHIERADGSIRALMPPCEHDRFSTEGAQIAKDGPVFAAPEDADGLASSLRDGVAPTEAMSPAQANGYLKRVEAFVYTGSDATYTSTTVPFAPVTVGNQIIHLFSGLMPVDRSNILQPVISWNAWYFDAFGRLRPSGPKWTTAPWECCSNAGNGIHGMPIVVQPGDVVYGSMEATGCGDFNGCAQWTISVHAPTGSSSVNWWNTFGLVMTRPLGGALEVKLLDTCRHLPSSNFAVFHTAVHAMAPINDFTQPSWSVIGPGNCNARFQSMPYENGTSGWMGLWDWSL